MHLFIAVSFIVATAAAFEIENLDDKRNHLNEAMQCGWSDWGTTYRVEVY